MPFKQMQDPGSAENESVFGSRKPEMEDNPHWPLIVAILDKELERHKRTTAVLVSAFAYEDPKEGSLIHVPVHYVTDFASIPAFLRGFISPFGRHAKAAVLHDWLYAVGEPKRRVFADCVFSRAMKELGVPWLARLTMFLGVRIGGGKPYKKADNEWQMAWADWKSGQRIDPPSDRQEWFQLNPIETVEE